MEQETVDLVHKHLLHEVIEAQGELNRAKAKYEKLGKIYDAFKNEMDKDGYVYHGMYDYRKEPESVISDPSTINSDLYAYLPPGKKEEYKALFPEPAKIMYPVHTPAGWGWCDNEFFIIPGQDNECLVMKVENVRRVLDCITGPAIRTINVDVPKGYRFFGDDLLIRCPEADAGNI